MHLAPMDHTIDDPTTYLHEKEDVEIINRAPGQAGPFSPIEKNEARTPRGNLTGYGIEIRDPDFEATHEHQADGWRFVGQVGKNYLLVTNEEAVRVVHDIIERSPFAHTPSKVFFDGKRFVYNTVFPDQRIEGPDESDITLGLQVRNSYNGSMRFQASLYAERLICSNGMTSTTHFSSHQFQHRQNNRGWTQDVEDALAVLEQANDQLTNFVGHLYTLSRMDITHEDLASLRRQDDGLGALPNTRFAEVYDRLITDEAPQHPSGYDVLNAATNVLWHRDKSVTDLDYNQEVVDQLVDFAEHRHN